MPLPLIPGLHQVRAVALKAQINELRAAYRAAPEFYPDTPRKIDALLDEYALLLKAAR